MLFFDVICRFIQCACVDQCACSRSNAHVYIDRPSSYIDRTLKSLKDPTSALTSPRSIIDLRYNNNDFLCKEVVLCNFQRSIPDRWRCIDKGRSGNFKTPRFPRTQSRPSAKCRRLFCRQTRRARTAEFCGAALNYYYYYYFWWWWLNQQNLECVRCGIIWFCRSGRSTLILF